MKKYLSFLLAMILMLSSIQIALAKEISFVDFGQEHWAYDFVSKLVLEGTINGYQDNTFLPDNTVSRAEFVKMIGKTNVRNSYEFNDVATNHWAYDYIMYSGLKPLNVINFEPDTPIKRGDVAELLWQRAGFVMGIDSPSIITTQHANKNVAAWIYQYGIMIGNDGVNLRFNDTLSRAEAATLIIRSREVSSNSKQISFMDTVSPELLKNIYNSLNLFDNKEFNPDQTVTNGEMARAVIKIGAQENNLTYKGFNAIPSFEHQYAKDVAIMGEYFIGKSNVTKEFADANANNMDTLISLTFNCIRKANQGYNYNILNNFYKDVSSVDYSLANGCLSFAYRNGVELYKDGILKPGEPVTLKNFMLMLIQLDSIVGTQTGYIIPSNGGNNIYEKFDQRIQTNLDIYNANTNKFSVVLADVPKSIYNTPYYIKYDGDNNGVPSAFYNFAREFKGVIIPMIDVFRNYLKTDKATDVRFTYMPSLACSNGNGYTLRLKCTILSAPEGATMGSVFNCSENVDKTIKVTKDMTFYADFLTVGATSVKELDSKKVSVDKIIEIL